MLPVALRDTGLLMLSVGILTSCAGLVAAWLVSHYEFPGRRFFEWALILPLAVPTYLAAYAYVEFLGFTGPPQQLVRALTGGLREPRWDGGHPSRRLRRRHPPLSRGGGPDRHEARWFHRGRSARNGTASR